MLSSLHAAPQQQQQPRRRSVALFQILLLSLRAATSSSLSLSLCLCLGLGLAVYRSMDGASGNATLVPSSPRSDESASVRWHRSVDHSPSPRPHVTLPAPRLRERWQPSRLRNRHASEPEGLPGDEQCLQPSSDSSGWSVRF